MSDLVLGPLVRHVDETSATVWVETERSATVSVGAADQSWQARTFAVHGHHFALVEVVGLEQGTVNPYTVAVDGEQVWPPVGSDFPPSVLSTLEPGKPLRLAYGSCRTSVGHDKDGHLKHGVDALRVYALRMAGKLAESAVDDARGEGPDPSGGPGGRSEPENWPDLVLFLGDQVYADETTDAMHDFISSRRDPSEPPWLELKDFAEYAELYRQAWTDEAIRWLLSTLPSAMIFDDHDVRDDWNTSQAWREEIEATTWWHGRIVAGLASYWVYQHLGNLSAEERAEDPMWQRVAGHDGDTELDLSDDLDAFAELANDEPTTYRWSYARDVGHSRIVVVDCRAARVLDEGRRSMLDAGELAWLDRQMRGDVDHLLVATSIPYLLVPGLHHLESFDEALAAGAWGARAARFGERLRQGIDLEHWGAFRESFDTMASMVTEVAAGERGAAPGSIVFLSGDVHHSYLAEAVLRDGRPLDSRVLQAVCSPMRNPLPQVFRVATALAGSALPGAVTHWLARRAGVSEPPLRWEVGKGPWYENALATLEVVDEGLRLRWEGAEIEGLDFDAPMVRTLADITVDTR